MDSVPSAKGLKDLTLEQLMDIEVTSVSRHVERLSTTASAIQVITGDDIRRSGASSLPEALRLVSNLQVAQANASQWAISARGFDNVIANKLLVMIDGRTVYTPLYAGVFWDAQNPRLEDIDRIEVISGPGGALWGANAVNGVINVITRNARDTKGLSIEAAKGDEIEGSGSIRAGGRLARNVYARVYGEGFDRDGTVLNSGVAALDDWHQYQGGFRMDAGVGERDGLTLQGDLYNGRPNPDATMPVISTGGNVLGRWTSTISPSSDLKAQFYVDRTHRDFRNGFTEGLTTYDADWQHRFQLGHPQEIVWGLGARFMDHRTTNLPLFLFQPEHRTLRLYSGFIQDQLSIADGLIRLTVGSKFEHNDYTGYEIQPSGRLAWSPAASHTIWAAVSRAVRTPSRIDRDFFLLLAPTVPFLAGSNFQSEEVLAYELGWRFQVESRFSVALSTFYNQYDNIRSAEPGPPPLGLPVLISNGVHGHTYGAELAADLRINRHWRLRGGYTRMEKRLSVKPGHRDSNNATAESDDPDQQVVLQSMADLPGRLEWDVVVRYVDSLPSPAVPDYVGLDVRLGWRVTRELDVSLVGQNLLQDTHREFIPSSPSPRLIERAVYAKIDFHW